MNRPTKGGRNKMKLRIRNKKVVFGVLALTIAFSMIAGAAVLTMYGSIETKAEVKQSVVLSEQAEGPWHIYTDPITRMIDGDPEVEGVQDIVPCNDYVYKTWVWNRANCVAEVEIEDTCMNSPDESEIGWKTIPGFDITHFIIGGEQTINFYTKDPATWEKIDHIGSLTFKTCNPTFDWYLEVDGATPETEYSVIYYADQQDRMDNWGGDPLRELFKFETDDVGHYHAGGKMNIPTMPYESDWNAGPEADYSEAPDEYDHARGAKIWIVPSADVDGIEDGTIWNPTTYFFEDDLALYLDCDEAYPEVTWLPYVFPCFETTSLESEGKYCWLTNYHPLVEIMPGTYGFETLLKPVFAEE